MPSKQLILCCPLLLFPSSGSFPVSWLFTSGGQIIESSASATVPQMNIQGWFPLELSSLISLQSKGLSRVFSNTTVQKHQFFGAQPSLWSNSHIHTWLLENHSFDYLDLCRQSNASAFEYAVLVGHSFSSKEEASFNFMAAVTICIDFGAQGNKVCHCFHFPPSICHEVIGLDAMILVFWMLRFMAAF